MASAIVEQIRGSAGFMANQASILTPESFAGASNSLATSYSLQVNVLTALSGEEAAQLSTAISESAFLDADKEALAAAVTAKVNELAAQGAAAIGRRTTQAFDTPEAYLTEQDWETLIDAGQPLSAKITCLADRLHLLDVLNPSEKSVRKIIALLACCHCPRANSSELYGYVMSFKNAISQRRGPSHRGLLQYPISPASLPADLRARAYAGAEPVSKEVSGLSVMLNKVPLRCTNASLSPGQVPLCAIAQCHGM